jgi:7-carboxy-7-deazaguanine synthase
MFITEIFKSIQGEGTRAGLPCIFVRLTGCNLRCTWCDTAYAFHGGKKMGVDEVLSRVDAIAGRGDDISGAKASVPLVELTGGEPLLQEEICGPIAGGSHQDRRRQMPGLRRAGYF